MDSASCHHLGSIQLAENILTRTFHMNAAHICMGTTITYGLYIRVGSLILCFCFSLLGICHGLLLVPLFFMPLSNYKMLRIALATDYHFLDGLINEV